MPPTHPNRAGRLEAETESFEFLNELALAFRAAENHPRPQCAPVLEGVRAVLAHLTAAGRLIPAGGMALTAEQVEDVRLLAQMCPWWSAEHVEQVQTRVRAMLPVAVHAGDDRCPEVNVMNDQCCFLLGHDGLHRACGYKWSTAPAEPAEEETKAEELQDVEVMQWDGTRKSIQAICDWVNSFDDELDDPTITYSFSSAAPDGVLDVSLATDEDYVRVSVGDFIVRDMQGNFYRRDRNAYATVETSSPVVPAPTETGPWPTADDVPDDVKFVSKGNEGWHSIWMRCGKGSTDYADLNNPKVHEPKGYQIWHVSAVNDLAPFVAAEEG